jgi:formylglycine-generating enzyme required for sulfatase activity
MKKNKMLIVGMLAASLIVLGTCASQPGGASPDAVPEGFVYIQGDTFIMGSPASEPERRRNEWQYQVTVSSFYMGKYEVTQKEWVAVMGTNPSSKEGDNLPVHNVSWYDAIEYCNKRSEREGLRPAYRIDKSRRDPNNKNILDNRGWVVTWNKKANGYRLPTLAEWEYACRAGTTTPFNTGDNISTDQANYNGYIPYNNNAKGTFRAQMITVGSFEPNAWGLYDMHGNVSEWCWDWIWDWAENYTYEALTDPSGPLSGFDRALRSGSWYESGGDLRSACQRESTPSTWDSSFGFRLVR